MDWFEIIKIMVNNGSMKPKLSSISDVNGIVLYDKNIYKIEKDYIEYYRYRIDQFGLGYKF